MALQRCFFISDSLHIEAEEHDVAVLHDVVLALAAHQAFFLGGGHAAAGHEVVVADHFGANEPALKIAVDLAGSLRGLVPFSMVQARTSLGPAVR